jgi:xylulose-5-phosphate/fructose-6-phosphate phosphoketolase
MDAAREHCAWGASTWRWASNDEGAAPDIVLACAGDVATLETIAAAAWLREKAPELRVRVVNLVDLMTLFSPAEHPHGMTNERFAELFTTDAHVVFAFHGYAGAVHQLLHGRPNAERFHVRGYNEEGTTTTPFDMVVLNGMSRYHLVSEAVKRARRPVPRGDMLVEECRSILAKHHVYVREHFEDMPEIRDFVWTAP